LAASVHETIVVASEDRLTGAVGKNERNNRNLWTRKRTAMKEAWFEGQFLYNGLYISVMSLPFQCCYYVQKSTDGDCLHADRNILMGIEMFHCLL